MSFCTAISIKQCKTILTGTAVLQHCEPTGDLHNPQVVLWGEHSKAGHLGWHTLTDDYL